MGVVGASGYAGAELLRLAARHPDFDVQIAAANSNAGQPITDLFPNLRSYSGRRFDEVVVQELAQLDVVFMALPHGTSAALTNQLPQQLPVIDLGADHRLRDSAAWARYYGTGAAAPAWTYGLPELPGRRREIESATKVANPGCYATAVELAAAPLIADSLVMPTDIVSVAGSGTSGAGRSQKIAHSASEVMGSVSTYKVGAHQHKAEISQELTTLAGRPVELSLTPLLLPMPRGILATVTMVPQPNVSLRQARESFQNHYDASPFVSLLAEDSWPNTAAVAGSNTALLQVAFDDTTGRVIVVCAIDNLGKGAAGQALQNANLMFGITEDAGLATDGVCP